MASVLVGNGHVGEALGDLNLADIRALQAAGLAGESAEDVAWADFILAAAADQDRSHLGRTCDASEQVAD